MAIVDTLYAYPLPVAAGILFLLTATVLWIRKDRRLNKINGPKGNIFVGIGLSLPLYATQRLREWAQQYGEVYKIRIGWYHWVVLNSPEAIKEVFDRQSISCSSKMPAPMGELVVGGMRMLTMPYGPKWRAYRTLVHGLLTPKIVQTFVPVQTLEIKQLMYDLAYNNFNDAAFYGHIRRALFSIMMTAVYGRRIDRMDHEDIKYSEQSGKLLGKLGKAGTFIEDEIPPLAKLPTWMQPSRTKALEHAKWVLWVKMRMWNTLQEQFDSGTAPPCYGADIMRSDYASQGLLKEDCAWIAGGLVEAGSQTSAATLSNLILYLAATPDAQAKAFQELQGVVGESRAPTYDDLVNLPYINACLKEILRLCPAPPWILRHFTDNDVVYKDYVIPKGTAIVGNTAAIHFDPVRYPDPFKFKPERYMHHTKRAAEYAAMADPYARDHFTFGAGRRICPGSRFAENALTLALAKMIWAFEIRPTLVMVDGKERDAEMNLSDDAFDEAPVKSAKPFKARFLPRSEARLEIVKEDWLAHGKA
ncbi:putative O-methylsterigmatocystin oxidoreductase [Cenococcum geophilum]